jgi:hypothetical protein
MENFFINLYELFVDGALLDDLIDEKMIVTFSVMSLLVPLTFALLFYKLYDRVGFSKRRHWLVVMFSSGMIVLLWILTACFTKENEQIPRPTAVVEENQEVQFMFDQGTSVFLEYSFEMLVLAFIYFFIFSLGLRLISTNNRKTPF